MEQYRKKLKISTIFTGISCIILAIFVVLGFTAEAELVELTPAVDDSHWQSAWRGLLSGSASGVLVVMVVGLIRSIRALHNDNRLRKLYIKETDERQMKIYTAARASSMQVFLMLGLVAGIAAGYFNMTVSITILTCVVIHSLIGMGFKIYYSKKY